MKPLCNQRSNLWKVAAGSNSCVVRRDIPVVARIITALSGYIIRRFCHAKYMLGPALFSWLALQNWPSPQDANDWLQSVLHVYGTFCRVSHGTHLFPRIFRRRHQSTTRNCFFPSWSLLSNWRTRNFFGLTDFDFFFVFTRTLTMPALLTWNGDPFFPSGSLALW